MWYYTKDGFCIGLNSELGIACGSEDIDKPLCTDNWFHGAFFVNGKISIVLPRFFKASKSSLAPKRRSMAFPHVERLLSHEHAWLLTLYY